MSVYGATSKIEDLANDSDDDWETDPDYVNDQTEYEQRRGGQKKDAFDIHAVRDHARTQDNSSRMNQYNASATRYGVAKQEDEQQRQQFGGSKPAGGTPGAPNW